MPEFNEVLVKKPVFLSGGGLFTFASVLTSTPATATSPTGATGDYQIRGDLSRRGIAWTQKDFASTFGATLVFLSRERYFVSSGPDFLDQFGLEFDLASPSIVGNRTTYHVIDNIFWLLGDNFTPMVMAKADGTSLTSSGGWVDRSGDLTGIVGSTYFMRKAADAGFLYYIVQNTFTGGLPYLIYRGAVATAPNAAFTSITTTPASPGTTSAILAYDVSPDGQVHIFANDQGQTYRSTDGGVSFSSTSPGISPIEITYSPAFDRWVMCSSGGTVRYSENSGASWSVPTRVDTHPANVGQFQTFSTTYHIERIDPAGRYLIMTSSYAPIRIHISEDGGKSWTFLQQMISPYYDTTQTPRSGATVTAQLALVRTPTSILLYQGTLSNTDPAPYNWNFDNGMFTSGPLDFPI